MRFEAVLLNCLHPLGAVLPFATGGGLVLYAELACAGALLITVLALRFGDKEFGVVAAPSAAA